MAWQRTPEDETRVPPAPAIEPVTAISPAASGGPDAHRRLVPVVALAALLPLTLLLTMVSAGPGILPGDVSIALWLQALPLPGAAEIARLGYWAGGAVVIVSVNVLLVVILWSWGRPRLAALWLLILLVRLLNPLLKLLLTSPRPTLDQVLVTEIATGYGFPSGHVNSATLLYGGIIWLAEQVIARVWLRRLIQIVAALLIFSTAFGRVYTGAHWPSDVLGGFLWGLTELALLAIIADRLLPRYFPERRPGPPHPGAETEGSAGERNAGARHSFAGAEATAG